LRGVRFGTEQVPTNPHHDQRENNNGYGWNKIKKSYHIGRWPANLVHDGSEEVLVLFPNTKATGTTDYDWEKSGDSNPVHKVNNLVGQFWGLNTECRFQLIRRLATDDFSSEPTI
jgi:hypothetical protein